MSRTLPRLLQLMAIATAILSAGRLSAQTVGGRLLEAESGNPIAGGSVLLISASGDTVRSAMSGNDGSYVVGAPSPGTYRLVGVRIGYRPAEVSPLRLDEGHQVVDLRLEVQALQLEQVEVRATQAPRPRELGGFYERQRQSIAGRFVTREEIEKFAHSRLSDILLSFGVQVTEQRGPQGGMVLSTRQGCLRLVIDGVRIPDRIMSHPDDLVNADDIEGVEIYRNFVEVPGEFVGGFNQCGAILVWTRYSR